jgi:hypothetical protein
MCCVAHKLEAEPEIFSFDKASGEVCAHLTRVDASVHRFQCGIWDALERVGCNGCLNYYCGGAGDQITQLFASIGLPADYRKSPGEEAFNFRWLEANRHNFFLWSVEVLRQVEDQYEGEWLSETGRDMYLRALEFTLTELASQLQQQGQGSQISETDFKSALQAHFQLVRAA